MEEQEKQTYSDKLQGRLLKTRTIIISGEITQDVAARVSAELLILQELGDEPIKLFINSQGGHVEAGDTIHDMIRFIKPRVIIIGTGWVASAGITIYLAAEKQDRYSLPNTRYMIHQPLGGVRGQATDIQIEAEEIIKIRRRINGLISERTGQPLEKVEKDTLRNYWLDAQEAKAYGIVQQIITGYDEGSAALAGQVREKAHSQAAAVYTEGEKPGSTLFDVLPEYSIDMLIKAGVWYNGRVLLGVVNFAITKELDLFTLIILLLILYGVTIGKGHIRQLDAWAQQKFSDDPRKLRE
ncbi:hypothetical protein Lal_00001043 [Lupinus albus]|nr:hypothetical protein Lal_00001043 [Lupinus albus]